MSMSARYQKINQLFHDIIYAKGVRGKNPNGSQSFFNKYPQQKGRNTIYQIADNARKQLQNMGVQIPSAMGKGTTASQAQQARNAYFKKHVGYIPPEPSNHPSGGNPGQSSQSNMKTMKYIAIGGGGLLLLSLMHRKKSS